MIKLTTRNDYYKAWCMIEDYTEEEYISWEDACNKFFLLNPQETVAKIEFKRYCAVRFSELEKQWKEDYSHGEKYYENN